MVLPDVSFLLQQGLRPKHPAWLNLQLISLSAGQRIILDGSQHLRLS